MALAKADRTPIVEILARTPELPENCQWGTFLRCHDELTLEMVTPEERQWMWNFYAPEPRMRLNLGIRRRLAPLMENDQRKIMLMHSLLLTMAGSPFLYYGDEIGMGDNIWLEDRNGVRTPMQWDASPNAGFSSAPAEALYAPLISDETYGYAHVNVAAQRADPNSLLNQLQHMLAVRKQHPVFGWGSFTWEDMGNNAIAAYRRDYNEETFLIINNLSAKSFELKLPSEFGHAQNILDSSFTNSSQILEPYQFLWLQLLRIEFVI